MAGLNIPFGRPNTEEYQTHIAHRPILGNGVSWRVTNLRKGNVVYFAQDAFQKTIGRFCQALSTGYVAPAEHGLPAQRSNEVLKIIWDQCPPTIRAEIAHLVHDFAHTPHPGTPISFNKKDYFPANMGTVNAIIALAEHILPELSLGARPRPDQQDVAKLLIECDISVLPARLKLADEIDLDAVANRLPKIPVRAHMKEPSQDRH